ncbi:MAG: hypothetical protein ACFCGT_08450 [Sandaracinaceae bacterium]
MDAREALQAHPGTEQTIEQVGAGEPGSRLGDERAERLVRRGRVEDASGEEPRPTEGPEQVAVEELPVLERLGSLGLHAEPGPPELLLEVDPALADPEHPEQPSRRRQAGLGDGAGLRIVGGAGQA